MRYQWKTTYGATFVADDAPPALRLWAENLDGALNLLTFPFDHVFAREILRLAQENRALKAESEEYQIFVGELVGRLGLDREQMEGKPDAVGNQILVVIEERMARIAALEAELAGTEEALRAEIVEHSEMLADRLREVTRLTTEREQLLDENRIHAAHRARVEAEVERLRAALSPARDFLAEFHNELERQGWLSRAKSVRTILASLEA